MSYEDQLIREQAIASQRLSSGGNVMDPTDLLDELCSILECERNPEALLEATKRAAHAEQSSCTKPHNEH